MVAVRKDTIDVLLLLNGFGVIQRGQAGVHPDCRNVEHGDVCIP